MLRIVKIVLAAAVAALGLLSGFFDFLGWSDTVAAVAKVTSMSSWEGGAQSWNCVNIPALNWLGAAWIAGLDLVYGALCAIGAARMWRSRNAGAIEFSAAKTLALAGCGLAAMMLFGGFIVVAETFFELWRSDVMRDAVLDSAYRYLGSVLLIALFIASKESE